MDLLMTWSVHKLTGYISLSLPRTMQSDGQEQALKYLRLNRSGLQVIMAMVDPSKPPSIPLSALTIKIIASLSTEESAKHTNCILARTSKSGRYHAHSLLPVIQKLIQFPIFRTSLGEDPFSVWSTSHDPWVHYAASWLNLEFHIRIKEGISNWSDTSDLLNSWSE